MRKVTSMVALIGFLCVWSLPAMVLASGFAIPEQGAKANAMGGAFAAQADDPSAVYYNPAGIVQLEGTQISAGLNTFITGASFESDGTSVAFTRSKTDADEGTFLVPSLFATHKMSDRFSLGLGIFSNYGLGTEWPDDWEGRYISGGTFAEVTTISLNPTVAYKPHEKFSIAAGLVAQYLDLTMENKVPNPFSPFVPGTDLDLKLTGDDWGYGFNVGLLYWITDELKFGASYRSEVKHSVTGADAELTGFPKDKGETDFDLPSVLYLGLAWTRGAWTVEFDAHMTGWSVYDELALDFERGAPLPDTVKPKDWDDTWAYRFGAQYQINDAFAIRAGIVFDEGPIPDETLDPIVPSGDRWIYTLGGGFHTGAWKIDLNYAYVDDDGGTFDNEVGDYNAAYGGGGRVTGEFTDVNCHIIGLSVAYRF